MAIIKKHTSAFSADFEKTMEPNVCLEMMVNRRQSRLEKKGGLVFLGGNIFVFPKRGGCSFIFERDMVLLQPHHHDVSDICCHTEDSMMFLFIKESFP